MKNAQDWLSFLIINYKLIILLEVKNEIIIFSIKSIHPEVNSGGRIKHGSFLHLHNHLWNLRIPGPAKNSFKRPVRLIPIKDISHNIVPVVLTVEKDSILIVNDLPGYAPEKLKCHFMCFYCTLTCKRCIPEKNELIPAMTAKTVKLTTWHRYKLTAPYRSKLATSCRSNLTTSE